MPRFQARRIPDFSLVIGTSRTKYVKPALVKSTIHSYRGATIQDLFETVLKYRPKLPNTFTIIAGFFDNRLHPKEVGQKGKNLINLTTNKFQSKTPIIPSIIQSSNDSDANRKLSIHNHVLLNLISNFVHPHTLIVSPNLNLNITPQKFYRDSIRHP